jgi:hypothetical protein
MIDLGRMEDMQEEFLDIAGTQTWPSEIVDGSFSRLRKEESNRRAAVQTLSPPLSLKGIKLVIHPQTDPLWFTFDDAGVLTRLGYYAVDYYPGRKAAAAPSRRFEFIHQSQASIQTTVGGPDLHLTALRLLDHLKRRYVPDLRVQDETGYWENRNEAALRRLMERR